MTSLWLKDPEIIKDDFFFSRTQENNGLWSLASLGSTALTAVAQLTLPMDTGQGWPPLFVDPLQ